MSAAPQQKPHGHHTTQGDAIYHFTAAGLAALINFPLWRAAAIGQSGFKLEGSNALVRYYKAVIHPPFRGVSATIFGMTWARAAIFFGSDMGKEYLRERGYHGAIVHTLPSFTLGTLVQVINMPLVRATITIQDPKSELPNTRRALVHLYQTRGLRGWFHGLSPAILKTVPKYMVTVAARDYMEEHLPDVDPNDKTAVMMRSAVKSVVAGVAGAALTNPLDVIRNEMFKTDLSLTKTCQKLMRENGWAFMGRGLASNMTSVASPLAMTIFLTDMLLSARNKL